MSEPDAESISDEELLRKTRALRDLLRPGVDQLSEVGIEVEPFLDDCDRVISFLEGRSEEWVDVAAFAEKAREFDNELREFVDIQRQADRINAVASIPRLLDEMEDLASRMSNPNDAGVAALLKAEAEAGRKRLERGEYPLEEIEDISISMNAGLGELNRRNRFRTAALALFWESRPPEWWAKLTEESRKELEELLVSWRAERETILGEMPIEDRRRLEALRPEDFDKPGVFDP